MRLRILGRHDPVLFAGLTFALLVVFQRSIQDMLDGARDIERTYGVALMPALLILSVMFVFHHHAKRREMKAESTAAAAEAASARLRTDELERLMLFGQTLARALSTDALREAVCCHLPSLATSGGAWVALRNESGWDRLIDSSCTRWSAGEVERIADEVAARPLVDQERPEGIEYDGHLCFVLLVDSRPEGILALHPGSDDASDRQKVGAAAALLTIAIRNTQLFANVRDHSVKDALTGCFNRAHTVEILEGEMARARRSSGTVSIVLFDVDHFKRINDGHGHLCGDSVLAAVGQRIRQVLRRSDVRCRYGGDEFLVVLPETSASGATRVAEWLRGEIEQIALMKSGERVSVTISAGVATSMAEDATPASLIDRADQALYRAKANGRNCVRAASDAPGLRAIESIPMSSAAFVSLPTH